MQKHFEEKGYPGYLEQFSIFYSELEKSPKYVKIPAMEQLTSEFALFTHAVTNRVFIVGIEILKKINKVLSGYLLEIDTQSILYDNAFKLYKFTVELQKQFEAFLQKKQRIRF